MRSSLVNVAGPTPQRRETGSGARNAASVPGSTTSTPSGLARSLASLARNLVEATPTDRHSPLSASTRRRMVAAIAAGAPSMRRAPATSMNASSIDSCSTSGEIDARIAITSWLLST